MRPSRAATLRGADPRPDDTLLVFGRGQGFPAHRLATPVGDLPAGVATPERTDARLGYRDDHQTELAVPTDDGWAVTTWACRAGVWVERATRRTGPATVARGPALGPLTWSLAAPAGPDAVELEVRYDCPIGPLVAAEVQEDEDVVVVTCAYQRSCSDRVIRLSQPAAEWRTSRVPLPNPLGHRRLLDGHHWPAEPPAQIRWQG